MSEHNVTLKFTALDAGMLDKLRQAKKELQELSSLSGAMGRNATAGLAAASTAVRNFGTASDRVTKQVAGNFNNVEKAAAGLDRAISGSAQRAVNGYGAASRSSAQFAATASKSAQAVVASNDRVVTSIDGIGRKIREMQRYAGWAAGLGIGAVTVTSVVDLIDGYTNLESKLRTVTSSEAQLNSVRESLFQVSQDTRQQLESTASLYARLTRATENQNLSDQARLRITETINKAFVVSGATAQEASASITQLSQGLAAGALRGEEFNSVAEQAPILLKLLADNLGKTRGELRAMAFDGKLTSEVITGILLTGAKEIDAQFAKMGLTIAGAGTQIANSFKVWLGEAQQGISAASLLASGLSLIAENLAPIANGLTLIGAALVTKYVVGLVAAQAAQTRTLQSAAAMAAAELNAARAAELNALSHATLAAALGSAAVASGGLTAAQTALAAAQARTAAAASANAAAQLANVGALGRLGGSLLAFVGGPVGVAILALGALAFAFSAALDADEKRQAQFRATIDATIEAADATAALVDQIESLNSLPPPLTEMSLQLTANAKLIEENEKRIESLQTRLAEMQQASQFAGNFGEGSIGFASASADIDEMSSKARELSQATEELESQNALLTDQFNSRFAPAAQLAKKLVDDLISAASVPDAFGILRAGIADFFDSINQVQSADVELNKILPEIQSQLAATEEKLKTAGKSAAEIAQETATLAREKAVLAGYNQTELSDLDELLKRYVSNEQALIKAKNANRDAARAKREAEAANKKALRDQEDALEAAEDNARAIEKVIKVYENFQQSTQGLEQSYENEIELLSRSNEEREIGAQLLSYMQENYEQLSNMTEGAARAALEHAENVIRTGEAGAKAKREINDLVEEFGNLGDTNLEKLLKSLDKLKAELADVSDPMSKAFDPKRAKELQSAVDGLTTHIKVETNAAFNDMISATQTALGSIQSMASSGSKAFKAMEVAIQALNVVQAIGAILNQGNGDPYSAFARMAAMAAAVAQLVGSIGSFSAGGQSSSSAAVRQQNQGTGTVLGDAEAKSESIANAVEITADATQELVGINRGMLNALQAMQRGISGASAGLARTQFGDLSLNSDQLYSVFGDPLGIGSRILGSIFGGGQELIDQGLLIRGGSFGNVSRNPSASSYQTIETDGGWFSSDDIDDELEELGEAATNQIRLILQSLGEAVREGALALGLNMEEINRAIEQFRIEEIRISTMDLTGEEAQAELEAAFSAIFDNLAGAVVPFIGQFQRVGEGLGETLVRVATSVQVTQEAISQLGLSLGELTPERMAQVSVGLIDAVGSIEEFISGMQSFVSNFAPEAHQFELAQDALTRALEGVGLTLPTTRDGMWELMQSLDATTESGQAQIATLLRLAGVADSYYDSLEQMAQDAADAIDEAAADLQSRLEARLAARRDAGEIFQTAQQRFAAPVTQRQANINSINSDIDGFRDRLIALGDPLNQVAELEDIRTAALERATAALDAEINGFLDDLAFDLNLDGLNETELALARINNQYDEYRLRLEAQGATVDQLARLELYRNEALAAATRAVQQQTVTFQELEQVLVDFAEQIENTTEKFKDPGFKRWIEELTGFAPLVEEALASRSATLSTVGRGYAAQIVDLELTRAGLQTQLNAALQASGGMTNILVTSLQQRIGLVTQAILEVGGSLDDALAYVNQLFDQQIGDLLDSLQREFGAVDPVADINARFDRLIEQALAYGATEEELQEINFYRQIALQRELQQETDSFYQSQLDWIRRLAALRDSLLLDEQLSTLTPQQRLEEAQRQFDAAYIAAQSGDADARARFESLAREYATQLRSYFSSTEEYTTAFNAIIDRINSLMLGAQNAVNGGTQIGSGPIPYGTAPGAPVGTPGSVAPGSMMVVSTPLVVDELKGLREDHERHTTRIVGKLDALGVKIDGLVTATNNQTAAIKSNADKGKVRA